MSVRLSHDDAADFAVFRVREPADAHDEFPAEEEPNQLERAGGGHVERCDGILAAVELLERVPVGMKEADLLAQRLENFADFRLEARGTERAHGKALGVLSLRLPYRTLSPLLGSRLEFAGKAIR